MTEMYCRQGFEAIRHYCGELPFSTWGPLTIPLTFRVSVFGGVTSLHDRPAACSRRAAPVMAGCCRNRSRRACIEVWRRLRVGLSILHHGNADTHNASFPPSTP